MHDRESVSWDGKPTRALERGSGIVDNLSSGSQACTAYNDKAGDKTATLMEEVLRRENLETAYKRVKRNKGAPGVDGMTVDELLPYCHEHWKEIREQLLNETYMPRSVKAVEIPKPNGGTRKLGIPVVLDRLIMQALLQVLQPVFEPLFSPSSHGYRPGHSAHTAMRCAGRYMNEGYDWVVCLDLEKFFDRVNHDVLMSRIARKIKDKRILRLIRRYLQAGIMEDGVSSPRMEGTPQGSPISPLLSNVLLNELDKELEERGHRFIRYADDVTVFVRSEAAGIRVLSSLEKFLSKRLRLKVNREKSEVVRPWNAKILGFSFLRGARLKIKVSASSVSRFRQKLKPLWRKGRGRSLKAAIVELNRIITGWTAYYRLSDIQWPFDRLDKWIRHRIRCIVWRQWKTPRTRMRNMLRRGAGIKAAKSAAYSGCGPWRASGLPGMHSAITNDTLKQMGLKSLLDEYRRFAYSI